MTTTQNRIVPAIRLGGKELNVTNVNDALKLSGLNWNVKKSDAPVRTEVLGNEGFQDVKFSEKFITYREDTMTGLGVVGKSYKVINNADAFSFLDNLVDDSGAMFASAGEIKGGRGVFVNMKMPKTLRFAGNTDAVDTYLMVKTSHDGSKSFEATVQSVRQICTNGMVGLVQDAKFVLRHTNYAAGKIAQARDVLQLVHAYEDSFQQAVEDLIAQEFSKQDYVRFVEKLVPEKISLETGKVSKTVETTRAELMGLWSAPTQTIVGNTKWAAYNAVAEWADWIKPVRGDRDEAIERAERIVEGQTDAIKVKALELLNR